MTFSKMLVTFHYNPVLFYETVHKEKLKDTSVVSLRQLLWLECVLCSKR